ncbi:unnamed protein product [Rhodiola kirilowii]
MASYSGKGGPANGSVYVCNLPEGTDEGMLAEYFGTIGLLKKDKRTGKPKIWLYHDKVTNEPKAESKNKDDYSGGTIRGGDPILGGRGDASAKPWQQDGDWACPNTSCTNVNFAFRGVCNRCGTARPAGAFGSSGRGGGLGRGRNNNDSGGAGRGTGGAPGLFGPNDWTCPMCANINWAKRLKCNVCNTNKPGHNEGGVRGGRAGGYKELDEEEIQETRRRRREAEEDDGEMYDEFGNLKKKFRAKTQTTIVAQAPRGAGRRRMGSVIDKYRREKSRDREHIDRESSRSRERHHNGSRERDQGEIGSVTMITMTETKIMGGTGIGQGTVTDTCSFEHHSISHQARFGFANARLLCSRQS